MQKLSLICIILCIYVIETKLTEDALERVLERKIADYDDHHYHSKGKTNWLKERLFGAKNKQCMLQRPCMTSLPQYASTKCQMERTKDLAIANAWYQITTAETTERKTAFPLTEIPWLNQKETEAAYYYALHPFLSRHLSLFSTLLKGFRANVRDPLRTQLADVPFDNVEIYKTLQQQLDAGTKGMMAPQYFDNPGCHKDTFTEFISNDEWMKDHVFAQSFLTNDIPFSVRKVTACDDVGFNFDKLKSMLNAAFNYDDALTLAYGEDITMQQAFEQEILFVVHFEQLNGIKAVKDFHDGQTGTSTMDEVTSPIALFIKNKEKELKIAVIQLDYLPDSTVLIPGRGLSWLKAKATVSMARTVAANSYYHLGHVHIVSTIFCTVFRRHFSKLHPLYEPLKYHCEGTTSSIVLTYNTLLYPGGFIEEGFAIGYPGFRNLSQQAFDDRYFGQFDHPTILKKTGIKKNEFKSYPYMEDGDVLWKEHGQFTKDLVRTLYGNDREVAEDSELQRFANELSSEGIIKFNGFPSTITSIKDLANTLRSIFWYNILHSVVNYPFAPAFPPARPTKLYTDATNEEFLSLGNVHHATGISSMATMLSSIRANRIMDYYDKVEDPKLRRIVRRSYSRLHGCIQKTLEKRNAERKKNGLPGMQYLEPKWLTNSIHI